jgi:hypothetical protein
MKKETKKVTKKETKKVTKKPKFIVDLTKAETCEDVKFEFIKAKATQGVAITEEDILFLINIGAEIAIKYIDMCIEEINKKTIKIHDEKLYSELEHILKKAMKPKKPWYKRFWGWMKKPFKKNK